MGYKIVWNGVLENYDVSNLSLFTSFCLLKQQRKKWPKERQGYFSTQFLFSGFSTILWWECFYEPVEITVPLGQGVIEISGIILVNCESSVSSIRGLWVRHVSLVIRYVQLTLLRGGDTTCCLARGLSKHIRSSWLSRDKKKSAGCLSQGMSRELRKSFFLVHLSRHARIALPVRGSFGEIVIFVLIYLFVYLFHFVFILFYSILYFMLLFF